MKWAIPLAEQLEPPAHGEPWKVAVVVGPGGEEANVFRHRIPAVKATKFGLGGRSHLVQQTYEGQVVYRNLHESEEDRLFAHKRVRLQWGSSADIRAQCRGNSAPPSIIEPVLAGIARFCEPKCPFVPSSIDEVIAPDDVRAFRGSLAMAFTDFKAMQKNNLTSITPGKDPSPSLVKRHKRKQAEGGLVFHTDLPMPLYLGEYWKTHDIDDIVPAEYLVGESSISKEAMRVFSAGFADAELSACLTGDGVPSKDAPQMGVNFLATNHSRSLYHHHLVDKMYQTELEAGRMVQFPVDYTPVFAGPAGVYPTGATTKKDRQGRVCEDQCRPTADYSWGPPGHWLNWLMRSPNSTVDLERDFPWVYYATTRDYMEEVVFLLALGGGVS